MTKGPSKHDGEPPVAENDTNDKTNILIAENERFLLRVLRHGLERPDYAITAVNSGDEVLRLVRGRAPDILIVDSEIRPMSGEELCRRVQTEFPERSFLTCILTAGAEDEFGNYAEWFRDFRMLEKPVSMHRLQDYIEAHLVDSTA